MRLQELKYFLKEISLKEREIKKLLAKFMQQPELFISLKGERNILGVMILEPASWETKILKKKSIKISNVFLKSHSYSSKKEIATKLIEKLDHKIVSEKIQFAFTRIEESNIPLIHSFLEKGFLFIETLLTLQKDLSKPFSRQLPTKKYLIRPWQKEEEKRVYQIALKSFSYSRFHTDPLIDNKIANLSRADWVRNACEKGNSQILVAEENGKVVGFLIWRISKDNKKKKGIIDLIAVDTLFRNKGIGSSLISALLNILRDKVEYVCAGTQSTNFKALNLYLKHGFRIVKSEVTLHKHYTF